jgi:putative transposase
VSAYKLIDAERASFPVSALCKVLKVSRSGYYDWKERSPSRRSREDAALSSKVHEIYERSRGTYGSPRVHAELRSIGIRCSRKRVARLMRKEGLRGCIRGPRKHTTRPNKHAVPAEDLVRREFAAPAPNKLWTADITYINTEEGFLYLAFVLDVYSRRLVGWAMESHLRTELVLDALEMAIWRRRPARGLIHHSDQGAQYTALSFGKRLEEVGIVPSMGRVGSALDNAISESFVATLKTELVSRSRFPSRKVAKTAIFEYLEVFYNRTRLHSSLGYRSPADFEGDRMRESRAA